MLRNSAGTADWRLSEANNGEPNVSLGLRPQQWEIDDECRPTFILLQIEARCVTINFKVPADYCNQLFFQTCQAIRRQFESVMNQHKTHAVFGFGFSALGFSLKKTSLKLAR